MNLSNGDRHDVCRVHFCTEKVTQIIRGAAFLIAFLRVQRIDYRDFLQRFDPLSQVHLEFQNYTDKCVQALEVHFFPLFLFFLLLLFQAV